MSGLRHLWMDTGRGFDEKSYHNSGIAVLAGTAGLTVLIWLAALFGW
jgi:succinate dehydrogenase/fumarate reductase cytochrome b subunit